MWSDYKREKVTIAEGEFEQLEEAGFQTDRVYIKSGVVFPYFTATYLLEMGFLPKGTKVRFLDENGTQWHRDYAKACGIEKDQVLTIARTIVGDWNSEYYFEEVEGSFNTVMFRGPVC